MAPRFRPAVASQSFGRAPHHRIEHKLALCAEYGFEAVEIFYEDLELLAQDLRRTDASLTKESSLLAAATRIADLCAQLDLFIICLQPFANYEGLVDRKAHASRIQELYFWIRLAQNLKTDLIQVPSSYLPAAECCSSRDLIIADLQELCDVGLSHTPPIRFAHEALCWATHHSFWTDVWDLVLAVDRPNFGTCLDTFNLLGREYADPTAPSGKTPNAEEQLTTTLHNLRTRLDPSKIFYIEAVDGERLDAPLVEGHPFHNADQVPRMSWSRNARLFPFEERGYLPVTEILKAIEDVGYEGYVAFEFFSRTAHEQGEHVPIEHAQRAQKSWRKICEAMGWEYEERWATGWLPKSTSAIANEERAAANSSKDCDITTQASAKPPSGTASPLLKTQGPRASTPTSRPESAHKQSWTTPQVLQAH
ncbi:3-dehydroshikimate dehydratase [Cyphellophora attinorum]|uniref:3-dehydroshikimate dehydratase n=1 Tax=Cyphellophora attinorum TaxID=1664694 RepID=A0A0N1GXQ6_9EURO|nr:3-dehydroshikimate dehydratase [Phialophora attinorum]KPI35222.1 3-dehydroshikimate dehydratase [Phialophora attinorum]